MDAGDESVRREAQELEIALAATRKNSNAPAATGYCLNCGDRVGDGRRWCDADCRDDWQSAQNL